MKQNGFIYATRSATKHNYKSVITLFTQKGNIYNNKIYIYNNHNHKLYVFSSRFMC